jgi:TonB family protein
MNGRLPVNLFSLLPVAAPASDAYPGWGWGRLYAALAISFALHATVLSLLHAGARSGGTPPSMPSARLDVVLKPPAPAGSGPVAGVPAAARGSASAEATPRPGRDRSRTLELPVPAPTYYTSEQLTRPPRPLSQPDLTPPQIARFISGYVVLKLWISELGEVASTEVEKSDLPPKISRSAAQAFAKVRFAPGEIDGRPVPSVMRIEVVHGQGGQRVQVRRQP